jgi:uncharacterized membrane protein YoaK (UPF0700 family)
MGDQASPVVPPRTKPHFLSTPVDLVLLTLAAGSADAAGYLGLGKIFTANMTGNIVLLGIAVSEGRSADTYRALFSLAAFVAGACAGGWLCARVEKKSWTPEISLVLGCEAALLLAFAIFWALLAPDRLFAFAYPLITLLSLSMGLQSAAVHRLGVPGVVTTVVTGTLTSLITGLTKAISNISTSPAESLEKPSSFGLQALVVFAYGAGGAAGGLLTFHAHAWTGFFPALIVVAIVLTRLGRHE